MPLYKEIKHKAESHLTTKQRRDKLASADLSAVDAFCLSRQHWRLTACTITTNRPETLNQLVFLEKQGYPSTPFQNLPFAHALERLIQTLL